MFSRDCAARRIRDRRMRRISRCAGLGVPTRTRPSPLRTVSHSPRCANNARALTCAADGDRGQTARPGDLMRVVPDECELNRFPLGTHLPADGRPPTPGDACPPHARACASAGAACRLRQLRTATRRVCLPRFDCADACYVRELPPSRMTSNDDNVRRTRKTQLMPCSAVALCAAATVQRVNGSPCSRAAGIMAQDARMLLAG